MRRPPSKKAGLRPLELLEKEGLALINGTQVMTAIGIFNLHEAENLAKTADIAGAMTFEAQLGSPSPFYDEIQDVRRHPGQMESARNILHLIKDSPLWLSHQGKKKVQDAYSVRCIPQVHGAVRDTLKHVRRVLEIETNSATENPLIFPDKKIILSGGNFHGEPVAFAMDFLAIAMTELGNISERRIDRLINPASNMGLPNFLVADNGLNSGFMIVHVTASALASENKSLAHPASVDNIPTSANQEDHVSMGTIGARKAREIIGNLAHILAIELMAAAQALDFYELKSSPPLESVKALIRQPGAFPERGHAHGRLHPPYFRTDRQRPGRRRRRKAGPAAPVMFQLILLAGIIYILFKWLRREHVPGAQSAVFRRTASGPESGRNGPGPGLRHLGPGRPGPLPSRGKGNPLFLFRGMPGEIPENIGRQQALSLTPISPPL